MKNLYALAFIGCWLISFQVKAASTDPLQQLVKTNPTVKTLKSSPVFEGRGDGVSTCPVTGEKITNKAYKLEHAGRTVYFCCKGCYQRGKRQPTKYLKPTITEQDQAVKVYLAKAPKNFDTGEFCDE